jgi:hypothetical protein
VQQRPQRPFVPHRTPRPSRQVEVRSEFRLSKPFVPGSSHEEPQEILAQPVVEVVETYQSRENLPPIDAFLDTSRRSAEAQLETAEEYPGGFTDEPDALPPIEHFLDPLPAVGSFAPDAVGALVDEFEAAVGNESATQATATEAGWVEEDWQRYDWRAAAALGDGVESAASSEWAATDWEMGATSPRGQQQSAAQAIASALDQIAKRIREGDLTVPPPGALTDPAAIAATLAALLGVRR